jgi:hypothetical protein
MALDHGVLNIPLSKRGNIDNQIDAYKADMAKADRAASRTRAEKMAADRIEAKALLAAASKDRLIDLAAKCKMSVPALRSQLKSDAHWAPRTVIGIFAPRTVA